MKNVIRNANPVFYERLVDHRITSLDELLSIGRRIQRDRAHVERYQPPPTSRRDMLEPDLAYDSVRSTRPVTRVAEATVPRERESERPSGPRSDRSLLGKCWHCFKAGHRFRGCPELGFCMRCGNRDLKDGACTRCQSNRQGNGGRRQKWFDPPCLLVSEVPVQFLSYCSTLKCAAKEG